MLSSGISASESLGKKKIYIIGGDQDTTLCKQILFPASDSKSCAALV